MGHQLITLLGSGIEADGIIYLVIGGIRYLLITAIDGRTAGIDQMLHRMMTTSFQDVVEAYQVTLNITIRIGDAVAHTSLSSEVDDNIYFVFYKYILNKGLVSNATFDEGPFFRQTFDFFQSLVFETDIVIISNRIYAYNFYFIKVFQQPPYQITADEPRSTCNQNGLAIQIYIIFQHGINLF